MIIDRQHCLEIFGPAPAARMAEMERRTTGKEAETAARDYLVSQGLQIVCENFNCKMGELDIVGIHKGVLIIIEVRMRSKTDFGGAAASISGRKRSRIILATKYFLMRSPQLRQLPVRFDVIALDSKSPSDQKRIVWLRGAFQARPRD
jgi:putative endonuclease